MAPLPVPWPRNFRPNPNNFNVLFNTLSASLGTGGRALSTSTTTNVYLGIPRGRTFAVYNASMQGPTAFSGSGAMSAQLVRLNNQASPTAVTLTAATSITAGVITSATDNNVEWTITPATNGANVCLPGDTLYWKCIVAGDSTAGELKAVVDIAVIS